MFTKHASELTYDDIDDLVNISKEREGYHLDFKGELGNIDKAKKELAKDITSFANTSGGFLIIGVDKDYKIVGIDKIVQNRAIDEWINQILSSNIEPQVFYFDPKIIPIPNSDKVIVVIHTPESNRKPHIVTEWNAYHIRINDSSKSANHNQIRDMFELSKRRTDEFSEFISKRNLFDEDSPDFGRNKNSKQLYSEVNGRLLKPTPLVIFSLFPKNPNEDKFNIPFKEFHDWFRKRTKGYNPCSDRDIFIGYNYDLRLDGVLLKNMHAELLTSYFEVLNNGYIEAGLSNSFTKIYPNPLDNNKSNVSINLTQIIVYEMMLLEFSKEFYAHIKYFDEIMLQLSFVNMLGYCITGLNEKYQVSPQYTNTEHANFKLTYRFNPKTLTYEEILKIAKHHAERICRAFRLSTECCFVNDDLSLIEMNDFCV